MSNLWPVITILGPILLAAVLIFAIVRNKARSRTDVARSEAATRDLYASEDVRAHQDGAIGGTPAPTDVAR